MELVGRRSERGVLDRLLADVRVGHSRVLVLHGEAGVGKTALLDYVAAEAADIRLLRASGVQSEMELAFAALQQLCAPVLDHLDRLPAPQGGALRTAFGLTGGPAPDRFLVGLAMLSLLSDVAEERPLLCLVDDEHWLDRGSTQILAFVARRLAAESVALLLATRMPSPELASLPQLEVGGLPETDARALLDSVLPAPLDPRVRDQIIAETRGNPLALVELPKGLSSHQLAGGFGLPGDVTLPGSVEESFRLRICTVPERSRLLLLVAAVETTGNPALVWQAAARLGIAADDATPVVAAGLVDFGTRVRFRHPLVRSTVYRSASVEQRQLVHGAIAEATDPDSDPDRRAWHLANATAGPDDEVASELVRSAGRARARGGLPAAAAFLERATALTVEPVRRADRAIGAAEAHMHAGAFDAALQLLAAAESGPLTESQRVEVDVIRARLTYLMSRGSEAVQLLLKAAERLGRIDAELARRTYLDALAAALFAGRLVTGAGIPELARAVAAAPAPRTVPTPLDLLLDGFAANYNDGYAAGLPMLREALATFGHGMTADDELRWTFLAYIAAIHLWDDERWPAVAARHVELARGAGALSEIPVALSARAFTLLFKGDLGGAASGIHESRAATEAIGGDLAPYAALGLAALSGDRERASALIDATLTDVARRGEGNGITVASWADALLNNGIGDYRRALTAAQRATADPTALGSANWALAELVEAAVRSGRSEIAAEAYHRLAEMTGCSGTAWALGIRARAGALLSDDDTAERLYCEAIDHLGRTWVRTELARAHLLYGEWLRRQLRRTDARSQLRTAYELFESMGMTAFAERALRELRATGETSRRRTPATVVSELTPQEAQIARMARDGLSNPEIGTRLFLSARTVQYHLGKVFTKLGISSRSQLGEALGRS